MSGTKTQKRFILICFIVALCVIFSSCLPSFGKNGKSAYEIAVANGFEGTEAQWLLSLKDGKSAYDIAVENGFTGTEREWLDSLKGTSGSDGAPLDIYGIYQAYQANGGLLDFESFLKEFLSSGDYGSVDYAAAIALRSTVSIIAAFGVGAYAGSGVIISFDVAAGTAYIMTNYHVVCDASVGAYNGISQNIEVYLYGQYQYSDYKIPAVFVGGAPDNDIAVLKVTGSELLKNNNFVQAVQSADSDAVYPGQTAIAVGNPKGKGLAVTSGVISLESENIELPGIYNSSTTVTMRIIRIDTPINSGNSGGGLFDKNGRLIGVVNAKSIETNVDDFGYAIPSNVAIGIAENIIFHAGTGLKYLIGITTSVGGISDVYDPLTQRTEAVHSVKVIDVTAGKPAALGGIKADDRIVSVTLKRGGSTVASKDIKRSYSLSEFMYKARSGDVLTVNVIRVVGGIDTAVAVNITISSSYNDTIK
ncbi:MAG: S1C family serine protease [Clostridiales bacterium]|jgi:S1-C subfamily serine protease|nr:S1C family serine protease [Clostridiales bacterium]